MLGYDYLTINKSGNLSVNGCDCTMLAEKYGTPLYIMCEGEIRNRCREIKQDHIDKYSGRAVFASKAFLNKEMCRIISSEGLGLDVVSGGELYTAAMANFPMERIIFHGSNKSLRELEMAIDLGVGRIVIDNLYELEILTDILETKDKSINVMIRIVPGIEGDTHDYIKTGQVDSKFGLSLVDGSAIKAVQIIKDSEKIILKGIHGHIGSQLVENSVYIKQIKVMADFIKGINSLYQLTIEELNIGGGFGVYYNEGDERKGIAYFTELINNVVIEEFDKRNLFRPIVIIEPGRWICAEAGITLYTVGAIKEIQDIRKYVSVDGGMTDNIRPSLYGARYTAIPVNYMSEKPKELITIVGRCCESGDVIIRDIEMERLESGETIAVLSTGAYNYSMSSNYNRIPKPPVIMIDQGVDRIIVKGETYEDILRNDI